MNTVAVSTKASVCIALCFAMFGAHAQWKLTILNPGNPFSSEGHGVHSGHQVGSVIVGKPQAVVWSGTAGSWIGLNPPGAIYSECRGAYGDRQVGVALFDGFFHGGVWMGTAGSWIDLTPSGTNRSSAAGIYQNMQVGDAFEPPRASLWFGTAASRVDLHPAGAISSSARGIDASRQAGSANFGAGDRAGAWNGTAASWNELHPIGAELSQAWDVAGSQVVGFATVGGIRRAHLWDGASPIDLHPDGAEESWAYAVETGRQVGYVIERGVYRASLWTGTPGSLFDLHSSLSPGSTFSIAKAIWVDGDRMHVVGSGNTSGVTEALLWSCRLIAPTSFTLIGGRLASGGLTSLLESDNNRLVVNPGVVFSTGEPPIQLRVESTAPTQSPTGFAFSVESSASFGGCLQSVSLYNFELGVYESLQSQIIATTDDTVNVVVRANPGRFIQAGTSTVRALVAFRATAPAFAYPWSARVDKAWWTFPL
jgi:hypothetical protein